MIKCFVDLFQFVKEQLQVTCSRYTQLYDTVIRYIFFILIRFVKVTAVARFEPAAAAWRSRTQPVGSLCPICMRTFYCIYRHTYIYFTADYSVTYSFWKQNFHKLYKPEQTPFHPHTNSITLNYALVFFNEYHQMRIPHIHNVRSLSMAVVCGWEGLIAQHDSVRLHV